MFWIASVEEPVEPRHREVDTCEPAEAYPARHKNVLYVVVFA